MSPACRRIAVVALAAVGGAAAAAGKLPGSLGFLQWNPDPARQYAPQLAALSLATNATTPLVNFSDNSYESSYIKITAYDAAAGLWTVNLQFQGDDNVGLLAVTNVSHGKAALQRTVNSTFCFFLAADPRDENTLLCLTRACAAGCGRRIGHAGLPASAARALTPLHARASAPSACCRGPVLHAAGRACVTGVGAPAPGCCRAHPAGAPGHADGRRGRW
jgi:hypothetical protein